MTPDLLADTIETNHRSLRERLSAAVDARPTADRPRDLFPDIDTFLAAASRHNAAFNAVILPEVRSHIPDGHLRARDFTRQSKVFEVALAQLKAKLYGEAHAMHDAWPDVLADVGRHADATWRMERALVAELRYADLPEVRNELVGAFDRAERHAPTRPHPFIPHQGVTGQTARRLAQLVDAFWDMAEGRMVPEPVRVHDRSHDGLLTQWLLADPHFADEDEPGPEGGVSDASR
jgi:hypothetical protein